MIADYTPDQFRTLAHMSVPPSGEVRPVDERSRIRFAGLTDSGTDAICVYLGTALATEQRAP